MAKYTVNLCAFVEVEVEAECSESELVDSIHDLLDDELMNSPDVKILSVHGDVADEGLRSITDESGNVIFEM